jgi:membrane protease YdiL (CAAX protease family)
MNINIKNTGHVPLELGIFIIIVALSVGMSFLKHLITKQPMIDDSDLEYLKLGKIFSVALVVPFLEEIFFRGFLNFDRSRIYLILFGIASVFVCTMPENKNIGLTLCSIIIILVIILCLNNSWYKHLTNFISNYLTILIVISSLCFGLVHLSNYDDFQFVNILVIIPHVLFGFFVSYIAVRHNIWVSLLYHSVNNIIPILILVIYYKLG